MDTIDGKSPGDQTLSGDMNLAAIITSNGSDNNTPKKPSCSGDEKSQKNNTATQPKLPHAGNIMFKHQHEANRPFFTNLSPENQQNVNKIFGKPVGFKIKDESTNICPNQTKEDRDKLLERFFSTDTLDADDNTSPTMQVELRRKSRIEKAKLFGLLWPTKQNADEGGSISDDEIVESNANDQDISKRVVSVGNAHDQLKDSPIFGQTSPLNRCKPRIMQPKKLTSGWLNISKARTRYRTKVEETKLVVKNTEGEGSGGGGNFSGDKCKRCAFDSGDDDKH